MTYRTEIREEYDVQEYYDLDPNTIYHNTEETKCFFLCPCGCGMISHLPLTKEKFVPEAWTFEIREGKPNFEPSINHLGFRCKTHFYIHGGELEILPPARQELVFNTTRPVDR